MSKLLETLKQAGWVETTLGECREGDEVFPLDGGMPRGKITRKDSGGRVFIDSCGPFIRVRQVLRAPRPEPDYPAGTVVRAAVAVERTPVYGGGGVVMRTSVKREEMNLVRMDHGAWASADSPWVDEDVEVLRVLAHPDGTTPDQEALVWDAERRYPAGTVVEAKCGTERALFVSIGYGPDSLTWFLPGFSRGKSSGEMLNPRVLFIPEEQEEDQ